MPRVAIAFIVALMLLTGIVLGQLQGISGVRSDISETSITPQKNVASDIGLDTPYEISSRLSPIDAAISPRTPHLERLTIDRFAQHSVLTHGGTIVAVEIGELVVHVSGLATTSYGDQSVALEHALAGIFRLKEGESVEIAPHASYRLSNSELQTARLLVLTVPHFDRASEPELTLTGSSLPNGVKRLETMNGAVIAPNRGPFRLDLFRMASPEVDVASLMPSDSTLLFVAGERLLAATGLSHVADSSSDQTVWIVTISAVLE